MLYVNKKNNKGDFLEGKKVNSDQIFQVIKKLTDNELLEIENVKDNNTIQNFILVFLEYLEKIKNLKEIDVKFMTTKNIVIRFEIDSYDVYAKNNNEILLKDILKFNCYDLKQCFIFDNYLKIVFQDDNLIYIN